MSVQARKQNNITVPVDFYLPPNTEGFIRVDLTRESDSQDEDGESGTDPVEVVYDGPGDQTGLVPPNFVNVVSQTLRFSANGQQVVDVLIDVEDVPGATDYGVRLTAA